MSPRFLWGYTAYIAEFCANDQKGCSIALALTEEKDPPFFQSIISVVFSLNSY